MAHYLYHITVRGNNKEKIFINDNDKERFLKILRVTKEKYQFALYAFALLQNHYHLLLKPVEDKTLSKIMQSLNTGYTMYFNKKYGRCGHVFQGRYKSILVEEETHLIELARYIHLNPFRAGLTDELEEYEYTSYPSYLMEMNTNLIDREEILSMFGQRRETQIRRFKCFVEEGRKRNTYKPEDYIKDVFLGKPGFIDNVKCELKDSSGQLDASVKV